MNCPSCGFNLKKEYRFCPACGTEVTMTTFSEPESASQKLVICEICGEENEESSLHCSSCGAKLNKEEVIEKPISPDVSKREEKVNKERQSVKQREPAKEKEVYKKANKPQHQTEKNSSTGISKTNMILLIAGLLLLGYVILDLSGVFDEPEHSHVNNAGTEGSSINLAEVESINQLEKQVLADTSKIDMVLQLAHKLGDSGFHDRAIKYYEMYLRQDPDNADVNVDLGVVHFELKQFSKAKNRMMKGLKINPSHQIAHFNIGVVNSSEGKLDSAKIWWQKAVNINPATDIGRRAQELLNSH